MQQTIHFDNPAEEQQSIDVRATIQRKIKSLNLWLDSKSAFYSRICEFSVTRRLVSQRPLSRELLRNNRLLIPKSS